MPNTEIDDLESTIDNLVLYLQNTCRDNKLLKAQIHQLHTENDELRNKNEQVVNKLKTMLHQINSIEKVS